VITTIHINIKIVGKPMLDKFLTGENVCILFGEISIFHSRVMGKKVFTNIV
jgi:hypothetical protein